MQAGDISAILMAVAALIGSYAALISARNSAAKIVDLEKENAKLRAENDAKTVHNAQQDAIIMDQQVKIEKWHHWGTHIGRVMNQMQLQIGAYQHSQHDTLPLPKLPDEKVEDE